MEVHWSKLAEKFVEPMPSEEVSCLLAFLRLYIKQGADVESLIRSETHFDAVSLMDYRSTVLASSPGHADKLRWSGLVLNY